MASATPAPALVLPSLQELGLPPVATAEQVVAAVVDIIRDLGQRSSFPIFVGAMKEAFGRLNLRVTLPANWVAIVRQAAQKHYTVTSEATEKRYITLVSGQASDSAAENPTLILAPAAFTQMTDAEVIADVQAMLCRTINKWSSTRSLSWSYDDLPVARRPPWGHCYHLILKAAEPHWCCTVDTQDRSIDFDPKQ